MGSRKFYRRVRWQKSRTSARIKYRGLFGPVVERQRRHPWNPGWGSAMPFKASTMRQLQAEPNPQETRK
jgi:hypothetical protein